MKMSKSKAKKKPAEKYDPRDWDESSVTEVIPEPRMKTGLSTSIRLPASMVNKLRKIAEKKAILAIKRLSRSGLLSDLRKTP